MHRIKARRSRIRLVELSQSGNDFLIFASCILFSAILFAGCEQELEEDVVVLARGPDPERIFVPSDYATRAIEAAGGLEAWLNVKELQLDCVVTFYQPDGSHYLTEQSYQVCPWSNSIQMSGREPQGGYLWQLVGAQFTALQGDGTFEGLPVAVGSRCLAEAILNIVTAPVRSLDESVVFARQPAIAKAHGQWYHPVVRTSIPGIARAERLSGAIFYQNAESLLFDMLWFSRMDGDKFLMVRGYDYTAVKKGGVSIPAKIEIFKTDVQGGSEKRLVTIDCHALRQTK